MKTKSLLAPPRVTWFVVAIYAIAMAWMESAVVLYLRRMLNRIVPYQEYPLPEIGGLAVPELIREAATLLMLATVGWLAGREARTRFAYSLIAFGIWDIFYYVFLVPLTGWPHSLLDWDVLFLLPLPWWGPVLAPVLIAGLMVVFGTLVTQVRNGESRAWPKWPSSLACGAGIMLALYVFMADALRVAPEGQMAVRRLLPVAFNWPLFLVALALMTWPVVDVVNQLRGPRRALLPEEAEPA